MTFREILLYILVAADFIDHFNRVKFEAFCCQALEISLPLESGASLGDECEMF